jgi:hypothetical protein
MRRVDARSAIHHKCLRTLTAYGGSRIRPSLLKRTAEEFPRVYPLAIGYRNEARIFWR